MGKNARAPVPSQASNMIHARMEHGIPDQEKANAMMTGACLCTICNSMVITKNNDTEHE
jgi:hypothetical protein